MSAAQQPTVDLWEIALGFMDSQVLLAADQLGVFDALDRAPADADGVAREVGLTPDAAQRLLTALCAMQVIRRDEQGLHHNGAEAAAQLVRGRPGYIGNMFEHVREHLYPVWRHAREALVEEQSQWHRAFPGAPAPTERFFDDEDGLRSFMAGMHAITYGAATQFAAAASELGALGEIVDVGGASGAFLIACAERHPQLHGTVFDLPPVRCIAEEAFRAAQLEDRLRFHEGNFWEDAIPPGADAYALGFILHDWDDDGGARLLAKVADACPRHGRLIIGEFLLDDDRTGPRFVARQDLNMLVAARGRERSAREYGEWIGRYGFELRRQYPTVGGKVYMVAERS